MKKRSAASLDVAAINDYHGTQDHYDGSQTGAR